MKTTIIHIKNMCCSRCVTAVTEALQKARVKVQSVTLGEARYTNPRNVRAETVSRALEHRGFALLSNEEEQLVERMKLSLIHAIHHSTPTTTKKINFSDYLEEHTGKSYRFLRRIFTQHTGQTVEKYIIAQKIEKVKELIEEGEKNFSEIAELIGYVTLNHLSSQFKKITGITMMQYKNNRKKRRKGIDTL